jgi:hypothetical protein
MSQKKKIIWIVVGVFAFLIIVSALISPDEVPTETTTENTTKATTTETTTVAETTAAAETADETTATEEELSEADISAMDPDERITYLADNVADTNNFTLIDASVNGDYCVVNAEVGSVWDEDHLIQQTTLYTVDCMQLIFEHIDVKGVKVVAYTTMIDGKGNENLEGVVSFLVLREEAEDINYENFKDMVLDYNVLINICEEVYIHSGIYQELKDIN